MADSPSLIRDKASMEDLAARLDEHITESRDLMVSLHKTIAVGNRPRWASPILVALCTVSILHTGMFVYLVQRLP